MFMEATANNYFTYKYPTGFALSGGFIKGFAHLGVMQALLEHGIRPDVLSGVSAGALAGVFYADGNEPHDVLRFFAGHTFQDLTKLVIPKVGLFELDEFIDFLRTNLKAKRLEQLKTPLIVTATDLDHGRLVHFHKGDIAERVAASCCMPVLFAPVCIDGTNYVDGGVLMNLPVSIIRRICEKVVAINVSPLLAPKYKMNIVSIALRSYNFPPIWPITATANWKKRRKSSCTATKRHRRPLPACWRKTEASGRRKKNENPINNPTVIT